MPDLVLFQPDIPGNTGTLLRLAACLDFTLHIIEPAGFRLDDINLKRAGMDYVELAKLQRHASWQNFEDWRTPLGHRLILLTTRGETTLPKVIFKPTDLLILGRESSGAPDTVHTAADCTILIPMQSNARSINMALSGAMVISEALRQTNTFPS